MTSWLEIPDFPGYSVSDSGLVRNENDGRILARGVNQSGLAYVCLYRRKQQYKKGLALLVADAFLNRPTYVHHRETFTTPINLDGNRLNNDVSNLMWRPRWFAFKFHAQFHSVWCTREIEEVETERLFLGTKPIATEFGLIGTHVQVAAINFTEHRSRNDWVFPTGQYFRFP